MFDYWVMKVSGLGHKHPDQNSTIIFSLWEDLTCYMMRPLQMRLPELSVSNTCHVQYFEANADNYKIFECSLVHLGYAYYRRL